MSATRMLIDTRALDVHSRRRRGRPAWRWRSVKTDPDAFCVNRLCIIACTSLPPVVQSTNLWASGESTRPRQRWPLCDSAFQLEQKSVRFRRSVATRRGARNIRPFCGLARTSRLPCFVLSHGHEPTRSIVGTRSALVTKSTSHLPQLFTRPEATRSEDHAAISSWIRWLGSGSLET